MGQERIFWGYFLILSYIYNILKYLKEKSKKLTSAKFWLILIPIVVALSNIHLMIILSIISFGFGLAMVPKKSLLILFSGLNVVLIVFSLLLNYNFLSTPSSNYYFNNIAQNTNQTEQIITAFSPVALTNQNLGLRVLIGSASWNTPTFFETARMENKLGFFSNLSFYFNQNAGFVYLFFLILTFVLGLFFVFKDKTYRNLGFPIIIFSILSLVFCFGYSFEFFRPFNQFLFSIPGSYIFREPGKIYLLFQILILVLAVVSLSKIFKSDNFLSKTKKKLLFAYPVLLCTLAVSGLIPFLALSSSLNFIQLPKIINYALNNCDNSTLAVLPNDTYIVPPSSQIFLVNPFTVCKSLGCKIIRPNKADLLQKTVIQSALISQAKTCN